MVISCHLGFRHASPTAARQQDSCLMRRRWASCTADRPQLGRTHYPEINISQLSAGALRSTGGPAPDPSGSAGTPCSGTASRSDWPRRSLSQPGDATKKAQASKRLYAFESVYGEWIGRAAMHATLALDAGVEARKVRIAEQHGELIAQVIRSILGDLGLSKRSRTRPRCRCHGACRPRWRAGSERGHEQRAGRPFLCTRSSTSGNAPKMASDSRSSDHFARIANTGRTRKDVPCA